MGRSVDYLNNALYVIYFDYDIGENAESWEYEDFKDNLVCTISNKLKSYFKSEKWDSNETKILLENNLCKIGISEYCGLWSLSIAVNENDYSEAYLNSFAKKHAEAIRRTLEKSLEQVGAKLLNKLGTFSNGEAVFEYSKK